MLKTLATILKDNWKWRKQIGHLAVFELIKKTRGAILNWAWLFIKPGIYMLVFWFALDIGLKAGGTNSYPPYFLWLLSGIIPWFFMREILNIGSNVYHRFSYLVVKVRFPLSGISTINSLSALIVHLGLMVIVLIVYFSFGMPLDLYLLQIPFIIVVMFIFFNIFSVLTSQLSALSKDFSNLLKSIVTPLFWLSGIIFDIYQVNIDWIHTLLLFNPVTFFATAYRDALYTKSWVWENPSALLVFLFVFVLTLVIMLVVYKRLHKEVSDAL
ncbi:MAG: ABC transporter permease [Coriobacteriia bacterium]|nr:ABC transporter permease [Coriobacteriia bacterium]